MSLLTSMSSVCVIGDSFLVASSLFAVCKALTFYRIFCLVCLSVCLVYLSACLSLCLSISTDLSLSHRVPVSSFLRFAC